jgi:N,N-dimethylformamidase beta subunit-like protein
MPPEIGRRQTTPSLQADPQPLRVADGENWVYQGTGLKSGDEIPHVYGQEADSFERAVPLQPCGRGPQEPPARPPAYRAGTFSVLATSAFSAAQVSADRVELIPTHLPVNSVVYQACSGAWVFAAGDIMWGDTLGPALILGKDYSSPQMQQITRNVLDVFATRAVAPSDPSAACVPSFQPVAQTALATLLDGE